MKDFESAGWFFDQTILPRVRPGQGKQSGSWSDHSAESHQDSQVWRFLKTWKFSDLVIFHKFPLTGCTFGVSQFRRTCKTFIVTDILERLRFAKQCFGRGNGRFIQSPPRSSHISTPKGASKSGLEIASPATPEILCSSPGKPQVCISNE
jgi:hypothetical protein